MVFAVARHVSASCSRSSVSTSIVLKKPVRRVSRGRERRSSHLECHLEFGILKDNAHAGLSNVRARGSK